MELVMERALRAGLTATFVITLLIYLCRAMGLYLDFPQMIGLFFVSSKFGAVVYTVGLLIHFTLGALFGLLYAWLFHVLEVPSNWLWGGIFGALHGILAGAFMSLLSLIHPRMGPEKSLPSPGLFFKNYGALIPIKFAFLHLSFGIIVGWLYTSGV